MKKYRFLSLLFAVVLVLSLTPCAFASDDSQPHYRAAIVVDGDNGDILYDYNAHTKMYPASVTKIMTSMVVLEAVEKGEISLDTQVTATAQEVNLPFGSSTAGILAGETLTVEDLLYCDLLPSANEACNILADAVGGNADGFVERMNNKAAALGMKDTHFANPHGLHDPEHYTTAYDIYLMAHEAMQNETFRTIVSTPVHTLPASNLRPEQVIYSTNGLLSNYYLMGYTYSKAIGIKTGYTEEAGRCLASAAVDAEGRTFYCVVLGSENTKDDNGVTQYWSFAESKRLLEWAFENFHRITLLGPDTPGVIRELSVTLSDDTDHVLVQPVGSIEATMPSNYDPTQAKFLVDLPESVAAPITAGDVLGTISIEYDGVNYGKLDMAATDSVARSDFLYTIDQIQHYWSQWWVKAIVIGAAALILLLVFYLALVRPRRKRARHYSYSGGGSRGGAHYRGRRR